MSRLTKESTRSTKCGATLEEARTPQLDGVLEGTPSMAIRQELKKAPERYERDEILRMRLGDASKHAWNTRSRPAQRIHGLESLGLLSPPPNIFSSNHIHSPLLTMQDNVTCHNTSLDTTTVLQFHLRPAVRLHRPSPHHGRTRRAGAALFKTTMRRNNARNVEDNITKFSPLLHQE